MVNIRIVVVSVRFNLNPLFLLEFVLVWI